LKFDPNNPFLTQRLALVTYKSVSPDPKTALLRAIEILDSLKPQETTDPETLGLSGAINKRLFELTDEIECLEKSLWFYERGFYIQQDYYNGINVPYLLLLMALKQTDKDQAISFYLQAKRIWVKVIEICNKLIDQDTFKDRDDKEWVYQSLGQAYLGFNNISELDKILLEIARYSKGQFDLDTFKEQNTKLINNIKEFQSKFNYS